MVNGDECRYCGANSVVPVLDKSIERKPTGGGNKFRRRCLSCYRWLPMTSEKYYRNHLHPHVLPVDADSDEEGCCVPLEEYDYGPEWRDLARKVGAVEDGGQRAMTDGGTDADADEADEAEESVENQFTCPYDDCDAEHTGYPDECGACGAVYEW